MELKKTPFYQKHIDNNGRMVNFGGWTLPIEYQSILKEAKACRTACGLFDASHMGEIRIRGKNALNFLQRLISNDLSLVKSNQMQYNLLINANGGVVDDLMVYTFAAKNCVVQNTDVLAAQYSAGLHNLSAEYLCVVNAFNSDKCFNWFSKNKEDGVEIVNESDKTALLCIQGPNSLALMEAVLGKKITTSYMHFSQEILAGKKVIISRSGYTGEDGFEIYSPWDDCVGIWDLIIEKGKKFGLTLCGLGSRDILRIEAGYPLYGHEIDDKINPLEASLHWAVKLDKDFIGKEAILEAKKNGLKRKRIGFIMQERAIPRQGYPVYLDAREIGQVSSATFSPNLDKFIGMAFIAVEFTKKDVNVEIKIRDNFYKAKLCGFSFIKQDKYRQY